MTTSSAPVVLSDIRVHPDASENTWPKDVKQVHLSILDNTCAKYARTCATWLFDSPTTDSAKICLAPSQLLRSFTRTIQSYPFWGGQLRWSPYDPTNEKGYQYRYGRLLVRFGGDNPEQYPGFGFTVVQHPAKLDEIVPSADERARQGVWAIDERFDSTAMLPTGEVALEDTVTLDGLPGLRVQVNHFACGGVGITIKMAHALADATSLMSFVRDWSNVNDCMVAERDLPVLRPFFEPGLLDKHAAGRLDEKEPDEDLIRRSRGLPAHRYDWFASQTEDCPPWFLPITMPPPDLDLSKDHSFARGNVMPWKEWEMLVPVRHSIFHFSAEEIRKMWQDATDGSGAEQGGISKMDALLAHVWAGIIRARELAPDEEAYLDTTLGMRTRLDLPEGFLGSPIRQIASKATATDSQATLAANIRRTVKAYDEPEALGAMLHDVAFDTTGQNIWATFLGRRHTLFTSWNRLGVYETTFGSKQIPRFVDAYMPTSDGLLQIMEAAPPVAREGSTGDWYENGASVSLHLRHDVMERLSKDAKLRTFA